MAASIYPTVTGTEPAWIVIGTNTPTSGTTVSFTSLSGYRIYKLMWGNVSVGAPTNASWSFTLSGSATGYSGVFDVGPSTAGDIAPIRSRTTNATSQSLIGSGVGQNMSSVMGFLIIYEGNTNSPTSYESMVAGSNTTPASISVTTRGMHSVSGTVSSLTITVGSAFSGANTGTFTLLGAN